MFGKALLCVLKQTRICCQYQKLGMSLSHSKLMKAVSRIQVICPLDEKVCCCEVVRGHISPFNNSTVFFSIEKIVMQSYAHFLRCLSRVSSKKSVHRYTAIGLILSLPCCCSCATRTRHIAFSTKRINIYLIIWRKRWLASFTQWLCDAVLQNAKFQPLFNQRLFGIWRCRYLRMWMSGILGFIKKLVSVIEVDRWLLCCGTRSLLANGWGIF